MTLLLGDCRQQLTTLADNSIDAVVTDPPYHLTTGKKGGTGLASVNLDSPYGRARIGTGFMGMKWDGGDIAFDPALWADVLRVLKPGGHLLAFGGTRTYHHMASAIEAAGFEIRDSIHWIYGTGFPKSLNAGDGRGTALKPAHEPIVLGRKALVGTVAKNLALHGTGALNIDACRIETSTEDQTYIAERIGGFNNTRSIGGNGAYAGGEVIDRTTYDASKGRRWPANVVFDDIAAAELDAARYFYCAKASRRVREQGCEVLPFRSAGEATGGRTEGSAGLNSPRAGASRTAGARNFHPTVKPVALMRWLVRLITPPGGTVLDPFMGSGTTGVACREEQRAFIGIELDPDYLAIAQARIGQQESNDARNNPAA